MAIRDRDDDYYWVFERNLRASSAQSRKENDSPEPKLADTLIEWATVMTGVAGVILLIGAAVTALS